MASAKPKLPEIYDYTDSRAYLRDWYDARKRSDRRFSYGAFAKKAELKGRAYLRNVSMGFSNLSGETAGRFARGLGLTREETEYFKLLVDYTQAESPRERETRWGTLRFWLWEHFRRELTSEMDGLFERWPRALVLVLTRLRDFRADPRWISRRLQGRITPGEAREALGFLLRNGLLQLRGKRMARTKAGNMLMTWDDEPGDALPMARRVYADATDFGRRRLASLRTTHTVLTAQEAERLLEAVRRKAIETTPQIKPGREKVDGELYMLLVDLVPLSSKPGLKRPASGPAR